MNHPTDPEYGPEGEVVCAKDWLGNRFCVGDVVMYCIGAGRGQMMAFGRVLKIKSVVCHRWKTRAAAEGETPTRGVWVDEEDTYDEVTVQVLTERTSGRWDNKKRTRPAWPNPMNITALPCVGLK